MFTVSIDIFEVLPGHGRAPAESYNRLATHHFLRMFGSTVAQYSSVNISKVSAWKMLEMLVTEIRFDPPLVILVPIVPKKPNLFATSDRHVDGKSLWPLRDFTLWHLAGTCVESPSSQAGYDCYMAMGNSHDP